MTDAARVLRQAAELFGRGYLVRNPFWGLPESTQLRVIEALLRAAEVAEGAT